MTAADVPGAYVPVAETSRSGVPESLHHGAVVALDRDGSIAFKAGDPAVAIYPRSALKPLQAVAMVDAGLRLPPEQLALVCASHDGSPAHLEGVLRILAAVGLDESALQNHPTLPLDLGAAEDVLRAGGGPTSLQQNCSGKHSAMIVTSIVNGWPVQPYLDLDHPVQRAIVARLGELAGETVSHVGIDGCGAPTHVFSLLGLARAFRAVASGAAGAAGDEVFAAMTGHPVMVGGEHRDVTVLMRHIPGLMAKDGAEGVFAAALADGRAIALKIADGANRARVPVMLAALGQLGIDVERVAPHVSQQIMGHGRAVGEVSAVVAFSA